MLSLSSHSFPFNMYVHCNGMWPQHMINCHKIPENTTSLLLRDQIVCKWNTKTDVCHYLAGLFESFLFSDWYLLCHCFSYVKKEWHLMRLTWHCWRFCVLNLKLCVGFCSRQIYTGKSKFLLNVESPHVDGMFSGWRAYRKNCEPCVIVAHWCISKDKPLGI